MKIPVIKKSELDCLCGINPNKMSIIKSGLAVPSGDTLTCNLQAINKDYLEDSTQRWLEKSRLIHQAHPLEIPETDNSHQYATQEIKDFREKNLDEQPATNKSTAPDANDPCKVKDNLNNREKICSKKCPVYDLSKASRTHPQRNAGTGSLCEWCKHRFPDGTLLGGWDIARNAPKARMQAIPAGSVLYLKVAKEQVRKLVMAVKDAVLSDELGYEGYGWAVCGAGVYKEETLKEDGYVQS